MFKFFKHSFSLDEFRVSSLVIGFIAILVSSIFAYFMFGDISNNLLALAETLIYVIGGVNAVNGVAKIVGRNKDESEFVKEDEDLSGLSEEEKDFKI